MRKTLLLPIIFLLSFIFVFASKPVYADTQPLQVSSDADDAAIETGTVFNIRGEDSAGGAYSGAYPTTNPYWGFARFALTSAIPNGSTVSNATFELYGWDLWNWDTPSDYLHLHVTDSANAAQPADMNTTPNGSNNVVEYPTIGSGIPWPASGGLNWSTSGWNTSVDISSLIQHLVDSYSGLAQGANIVVWFYAPASSNEEIGWRDWYYNTGACANHACAPKLNITYTTGPTPTPSPSPTPTNTPSPTPTIAPRSKDFTLSAWLNPSTSIASKAIIVKNNEIRMYTDASGHLVCQTHDGSDWQTAATSTTALSLSAWQHVACSFNDDRQLRVYINGTLESSQTLSTLTVNNTSNVWRFGSDAGAAYGDFNGKLDDVRIYNRSFTPTEISHLYRYGPAPVGYWKLDEGTGITANDSSGNGNNGTLTNGSWVSGKYGGAFKTDNNSRQDAITIGDPASGLLDFSNTQDYTTQIWHKFTTGGPSRIFSKGGAVSNAGYATSISIAGGGGSVWCNYTDGNGSGADQVEVLGSGTNDDKWHLITCVMDRDGSETGTVGLHAYIDGVWMGSDSSLTEGSAASSAENLILGDTDSNPDLNTTIDDVKIYNYARTPEQIIQDMNAGHPAPGSPVGSPVLWWKLDEGYDSTAHDSSATGTYDGTTSDGSWSNDGKFGKGYKFWVADDKISAGDVGFVDGLTQMTISMWVNPSILTAGHDFISKTNQSNQNNFDVRNDNITDELKVNIPTSLSDTGTMFITSNLDLTTDTWSHIVIVYNGSESELNRVKVYKNGISKNGYYSGTIPTSMTSGSTSNLTLGDSDQTGAQPQFGIFDEVKIYNFALTANQVKTEFNQGKSEVFGATSTDSSGVGTWSSTNSYCPPGQGSACVGPIAEWKFDEGSGTIANDTSDNGYIATLTDTGGPDTWVNGKSGQAFQTGGDSIDNYFSFDPVSLGTTNTTEFWIDYREVGDAVIVGNLAGNYAAYISGNDADDLIYYSAGSVNVSVTHGGLTSGQWVHFTIVRDGTSVKFYKNGSQLGTTQTLAANNSLTVKCLLNHCDGGSGIFPLLGAVDTIRFFDYARTPAQVAWDYNQGEPVGWWKLNENQTGDGQTVYDSSGNGNNGLSEGGTGNLDCTVTGKRNKACDFDGSDDYINIADNDKLDFSNDFSVSAWVYRDTENVIHTILAKKAHPATGDGYILNIWDDNKIYFQTSDGSNGCSDFSDITISPTSWHHVSAVYTANGGSTSDIKIYMDGKTVANSPSGCNMTPSDIPNANDLRIGSETDAGNPFDGKIDEVKLFNYALTSQQVKDEYNSGAVHFGP